MRRNLRPPSATGPGVYCNCGVKYVRVYYCGKGCAMGENDLIGNRQLAKKRRDARAL
jgi:hypothetical protein